jgi:hypothetical protein
MVEQNHLPKPLDKFDDVRFIKEKENEMKKPWSEFFPYQQKTFCVDR